MRPSRHVWKARPISAQWSEVRPVCRLHDAAEVAGCWTIQISGK
ncbi:hypothetical protein D559_0001 [Bordetella holmesii 1058]|uniref:N-acetyltransferase YedL n=1 Tax=Bordetella holmesii 1058 TaxID=1247648 RepID=A0ABP3BPB8_9BORD|nr:hypothetical protein D559_0001 [Bordetella holmesii 1058]